jgi:hypothetical protein
MVHIDQHPLKSNKKKELGLPAGTSKKAPKKDSTPKRGPPSSKEGTPKKKTPQKKVVASKSLLAWHTKRKRDTPEKQSRTESGECKHANLLC